MKDDGYSAEFIHRYIHWPSLRTIKRIIAEGRKAQNIAKKLGRPCITSGEEDFQILKIAFNEQKNLRTLTSTVNHVMHRRLSTSLVRRRIIAHGVEYTKKKFVPMLLEAHLRQRLKFCETNKNIDWSRVVFSDETTIELESQSARKWLFPGEKNSFGKTHYAKKQMFWAAISMDGKSTLVPLSGKVNAARYIELLQKNLVPFMSTLPQGRRYIFQQDNAPIHNAKATSTWFNTNKIKMMHWPPYSPDLNPIENLWGILKHRLIDRNIKTIPDLITIAQHEWDSIPLSHVKNSIKSMKNRISQVAHRGGEKCDY